MPRTDGHGTGVDGRGLRARGFSGPANQRTFPILATSGSPAAPPHGRNGSLPGGARAEYDLQLIRRAALARDACPQPPALSTAASSRTVAAIVFARHRMLIPPSGARYLSLCHCDPAPGNTRLVSAARPPERSVMPLWGSW